MTDDWPTRFTNEALAMVDAFLAKHPQYTRSGVEQPQQGATNRVIFARRGEELVVFKVFCDTERKARESFAYRHWRETCLVPELIWDDAPRMIVMPFLPGTHLPASREVDGEAPWREACREVGGAIGALTRVPLSTADRADFESRFYDGLGTLESCLGRIVELSRGVHARDPDFGDDFWRNSLDFVDSQVADIFSQPRCLYHQDVGNLHVQHGQFMGFYDLEMCRVGCAAMQLASSLGVLGGKSVAWGLFREGWETATGRPLALNDLTATAAAHHLLCWREICRHLSYDGTPGTGFEWASPADPARYRGSIEAVEDMIGLERP